MKKIRKKMVNCKTLAKVLDFFNKHVRKNKTTKAKED